MSDRNKYQSALDRFTKRRKKFQKEQKFQLPTKKPGIMGMGDVKVAEQEQSIPDEQTNKLLRGLKISPLAIENPLDLLKRAEQERPGRILSGDGSTDDILESSKSGELPGIMNVLKMVRGDFGQETQGQSVNGQTKILKPELKNEYYPHERTVPVIQEPKGGQKRGSFELTKNPLTGEEMMAPLQGTINNPDLYSKKRELLPKEQRQALENMQSDDPLLQREIDTERSKYTPKSKDYTNSFGKGFLNVLVTDPLKFMGGVLMHPTNKILKRGVKDNEIYKLGVDLSRQFEEDLPVNRNVEDLLSVQTAQGFGSLSGFMVGTMLTGGNGISGAILGAMSQGGQEFEQAFEKTGSEETALKTAIVNAIIGTSEALPIANFFGRMKKVKGMKDVLDNMVKNAAAQGFEEGLQEFFQQAATNMTARQLYDASRDLNEGVKEGGLVGFITGALLGGFGGIATLGYNAPETTKEDREYYKKILENEESGLNNSLKGTVEELKTGVKKFKEEPDASQKLLNMVDKSKLNVEQTPSNLPLTKGENLQVESTTKTASLPDGPLGQAETPAIEPSEKIPGLKEAMEELGVGTVESDKLKVEGKKKKSKSGNSGQLTVDSKKQEVIPEGKLVRGNTDGTLGTGKGVWVTDNIENAKTYGKKLEYIEKPKNPLKMEIQDAFDKYIGDIPFDEATEEQWNTLAEKIQQDGYDAIEITAPFDNALDTWIFERGKKQEAAQQRGGETRIKPEKLNKLFNKELRTQELQANWNKIKKGKTGEELHKLAFEIHDRIVGHPKYKNDHQQTKRNILASDFVREAITLKEKQQRSTLPGEQGAKEKKVGKSAEIEAIYDKYNTEENYTFQDMVADVDEYTKENDSMELQDAVQKYREAQQYDTELKGRGDMEQAEKEFENAIKSAIGGVKIDKSAIKEKGRKKAYDFSKLTADEIKQKIIESKDNAELTALQSALKNKPELVTKTEKGEKVKASVEGGKLKVESEKPISYAEAKKRIPKEGGYANASSFEALNAMSADQFAGSFALNAKYLYDKAQEKGINLRERLLNVDSDPETRIDQVMKLMDELGMPQTAKKPSGEVVKITDRINNIKGVELSQWNGDKMELTVLHKPSEKPETVKIRVLKALDETGMLRAVNTIKIREFDEDRDISPVDKKPAKQQSDRGTGNKPRGKMIKRSVYETQPGLSSKLSNARANIKKWEVELSEESDRLKTYKKNSKVYKASQDIIERLKRNIDGMQAVVDDIVSGAGEPPVKTPPVKPLIDKAVDVAEDKDVSLKEQKQNITAQIREAIDAALGDRKEDWLNYIKDYPERKDNFGQFIEGKEAIDGILNAGFDVTDEGKFNKVVFNIKGDGTYRIDYRALPMFLERIEKEFPTTQSGPKTKPIKGRGSMTAEERAKIEAWIKAGYEGEDYLTKAEKGTIEKVTAVAQDVYTELAAEAEDAGVSMITWENQIKRRAKISTQDLANLRPFMAQLFDDMLINPAKEQEAKFMKRMPEGRLKVEGKDITETEAFKRWFGESKVVDAAGKPLVVYSGHSNAEIWGTKYDPTKSTAGGFYATEDPSVASGYATGKWGIMETYENGSEYRLKGKTGKFNKKIWQYTLSEKQLEKLEELKNLKDKNDEYVYQGLSDMDSYIEEMRKHDKDAWRWWLRGGSKNLQNIFEFNESMGYNIAYDTLDKDGNQQARFLGQNKGEFEEILDALGIEWTSYTWSQPGVFPLYLKIENPLDAEKPFPTDLLQALKDFAKYKRNPKETDFNYTHWTKDYNIKSWIEDIENGREGWTTQIPKTALPILKEFGYDGIKELGLKGADLPREKRQINWIAFEPNQIKSATGNSGTFDAENPDIRFMGSSEKAEVKRQKEFMEAGDARLHGHKRLASREIVTAVVDRLKEALDFNVRLVDSDEMLALQKRMGVNDAVAHVAFTLPKMGDVVINTDLADSEAPIHEVGGHIFVRMVRDKKPGLWKSGRDIIGKDKAFLADVAERYPDLAGDDLLEEALAQAIGQEGKMLVETLKGRFMAWLDRFWRRVKEMLQLQMPNAKLRVERLDMRKATLKQFARAIAYDVLRGNKIVFESEVIDAAEDLGVEIPFGSQAGMPVPPNFARGKYADVFYSKLEQVAKEKIQNNATAAQVMNTLRNNGVKQEEIEWMGLEEWLNSEVGNGEIAKINKQKLLDFIAQNKVVLEEKVLGENDVEKQRRFEELPDILAQMDADENVNQEEYDRVNDEYQSLARELNIGTTTKYSQWQMPGGENYREILFKLPISEDITRKDVFKSSHFDGEANVLAHVRVNDRQVESSRLKVEGKKQKQGKMLFIEEVQSDWHQKGRKQGYRLKENDRKGAVERAKKIIDEWMTPPTKEQEKNIMEGFSKYEKNEIDKGELEDILEDNEISDVDINNLFANTEGVPDAPFKKTWHELVMKRMIRYAAENGYDAIGWTTGEQQNERYDLSKQVDSVSYETIKDSSDSEAKYNILVKPKGDDNYKNLGEFETAKLPDVVGKELADKIIKGEGVENKDGLKSFTGVDLKIGGEGMKGFYDKMLPGFVNKYVRKWNGEVVNGEIDKNLKSKWGIYDKITNELIDEGYETKEEAEEDNENRGLVKPIYQGTNIHRLDMTPAMKKSALYEGQAMFQKKAVDSKKQTETEAFKKWFGDSKVVDAAGKPLVVYHGTMADFNVFDIKKTGTNTFTTLENSGFFFSDSPSEASAYADPETWFGNMRFGGNVMPAYLSLQNPLIEEIYDKEEPAVWIDNYLYKFNDAKLQGKDGLIVKNVDTNELIAIAFSPTQIKSATGNRGTFDAGNPDIRFMKRKTPPQPSPKERGQTPAGLYVRKNKTISDKVFDNNLDKLGKIGAKILIDERSKSPRGTMPNAKAKPPNDKKQFGKTVNDIFSNPDNKKPFVLNEKQSDKLYEEAVKILNRLERDKANKEREYQKRTGKVFGRAVELTSEMFEGATTYEKIMDAFGLVTDQMQLKFLEDFYTKTVGRKLWRMISDTATKPAFVNRIFEQFGGVPDRETFKKLWGEMENKVREYKELAKEMANSLYFKDFKKKVPFTFVEQRKLEQLIRGSDTAEDIITILPTEANGLTESLVIDARMLKERANKVKELTIEMKKLAELYEVLPIETYNTKLPRKRVAWLLKFKAELEKLKASNEVQDPSAPDGAPPLNKGRILSAEWLDAKGNSKTLKFRNSAEIQERIDSTDKMIKNNFQKGGEGYFKRVYLSKEMEKKLSKYGLIKPTRLDLTGAMHREDIPLDVRVKMGEVLTAAYPTAKAILLEGKDISIGRFFEAVAENPLWSGQNAEAGWVQAPDSKKYGKLRNMWIHPDVWAALEDVIAFNDPKYADKFVKQLTATWKAVRVPMNPPTMARNFYTAWVMLDYSGTSWSQTAKFMPRAISEMRKYNKGLKEGEFTEIVGRLKDTTFTQQEMQKFLEIYDDIGIEQPGFMDLSAADKFLYLYKKITLVDTPIGRTALKMYQGSDLMFKMVKFLHMKEQGATDEEAIEEANKWMFDYGDVPRWVRKWRESILGAPFISWTYKVIPRVLEAAVTRPITFLKYPAIFYAITQAALANLDLDDEEWEQILTDMPDRMKQGQWLLIPFRDSKGQIQMLDLTFIMPYQDLYYLGLALWTLLNEGTMPTGATVIEGLGGMMQNPILQTAIELPMNYSRYTRREIWTEADTPAEKYLKMSDYLYKLWMPSWYPEVPGVSRGGYVYDKLRSAITGRPDYYGRVFDLGPAIGSSLLGLKTTPIDADKLVDDQIKRREGDILDMQQKKGQILKDDSIPREKREERARELDERINKLKNEIKEYEERQTPVGPEAMLLDRYIKGLQKQKNELADEDKKLEVEAEINRLKMDLDILKQEKYNKNQPEISNVKDRVLKQYKFGKLGAVLKAEIEKTMDKADVTSETIKKKVEDTRKMLEYLKDNKSVPSENRKAFEEMHRNLDNIIELKKQVNDLNKIYEDAGLKQSDGKDYEYRPEDKEEKKFKIDKTRVKRLLRNRFETLRKSLDDKKITREQYNKQREATRKAIELIKN